MKTIIKRIIRTAAAFAVLLALLISCGRLVSDTDIWNAFYSMPHRCTDVILIGASTMYTYYQHPQAYAEQGFTSFPLGNPLQPLALAPFIIDEALRFQDPELFAVEVRGVVRAPEKDIDPEETDNSSKYTIADVTLSAMSFFSPVRAKAVRDYFSDDPDTPFIQHILPILNYHDNIYKLSFDQIAERIGNRFETYFGSGKKTGILDLSSDGLDPENHIPDPNTHLSDESRQKLDAIAAKCAEHGKKLLFYLTPFSNSSETTALRAELAEYMEEKGYDFIDCNLFFDEIGFDYSEDFCDSVHANLTGARKFTSWFAAYLADRYEPGGACPDKLLKKWDRLASEWEELYPELEKEMHLVPVP